LSEACSQFESLAQNIFVLKNELTTNLTLSVRDLWGKNIYNYDIYLNENAFFILFNIGFKTV
jgi:hypothetical protein